MGFWDLFNTSAMKDELIYQLRENNAYWQGKYRESERLRQDEWGNPYNWSTYNGSYQGITGLKFPLNTCIAINDKTIKAQALKLKGKDLKETAEKVEAWLYTRMRYVVDKDNNFHKGYVEYWQPASMTFALKEADCDDFALLFQTMMHQLGYGKETIVCAGECVFPKQGDVGHAYNRILVDGVWVVMDACVGAFNRRNINYPSMTDEWFILNYWGVYKV